MSAGDEISLGSESSSGSDSSGMNSFLGANFNDSDNENEQPCMVNELAKWMLTFKISRTASNELLGILHRNGHADLPKCTRTILQTPRDVASEKKCGGDYVYLVFLEA